MVTKTICPLSGEREIYRLIGYRRQLMRNELTAAEQVFPVSGKRDDGK